MSPALASPVAFVLAAAAVLILLITYTIAERTEDQAAFESELADQRARFLDETPDMSYRDLIGAIPCDPRLKTRHVRMADLRSTTVATTSDRSPVVKLPARA